MDVDMFTKVMKWILVLFLVIPFTILATIEYQEYKNSNDSSYLIYQHLKYKPYEDFQGDTTNTVDLLTEIWLGEHLLVTSVDEFNMNTVDSIKQVRMIQARQLVNKFKEVYEYVEIEQ